MPKRVCHFDLQWVQNKELEKILEVNFGSKLLYSNQIMTRP